MPTLKNISVYRTNLQNVMLLSVPEVVRVLQVSKLRHSRDKLLGEIDRQWEEIDKLAGEHKGLSEETRLLHDELQRTRQLAASWERQAQDSLAHIDTLKDLLEESATWSGATCAPGGGRQPGDAASGGGACRSRAARWRRGVRC